MSQINESETSEFIRQMHRASSPTVTRHENRIKELEELLDLERESRKRVERTNVELDEQLEMINSQICESSVSSSQYNEAIRRRDADIARLRKELDKLSLHMETSEPDLRKRNHVCIMELKIEVESLQKQKQKSEKDKMILLKELESSLVQCDTSTKLKVTLEAKVENLESQLARSKGAVDELDRQVKDLTNHKTMLSEENGTLKITVKEVTNQNNTLRRSKFGLELQLDESKKNAEEETRLKELAQGQSHRLHIDNDQMKVQLEEEAECRNRLQQQLVKVNGEVSVLRTKYDSDMSESAMTLEDLRKKSFTRINELTEEIDREHSRINSLEKNRQQLALESAELSSELTRVETEVENLHHHTKSLESTNKDLDNQLQELINETTKLRMTNCKLSSENGKLRVNGEEEELKNISLVKNNNILSSQLKADSDRLDCVSKELSEVQFVRGQLESEKLDLVIALEENKEWLMDTERKYQSSHSCLLQLKTDMEQRLTEKTEELEALRKSSQRTIEDLSISLNELETKYKTEITKLKKKSEIQSKQMQENLDALQKENVEATRELHDVSAKLKELENSFEEEKHDLLLVQEKLSSSERRRVQLNGDLEDSNRLLDAADKSRRNIQMEIELISEKSVDYVAQINSLANDKRKLENEIAALKADLDDVTVRKMDSEERAAKLSNEANVLMDELKQEQELNRKSEALKKHMVLELKEAKTKLDQRESATAKDMAKNSTLYQERLKELELELESERARNKEFQIHTKKQYRLMKELQHEADDERNTMFELQHLLEGAHAKINGYKKQLDELESENAENLSRYRRAKKQIDEVDQRGVTTIERRSVVNSCSRMSGTDTGFYVGTGAR